MGNQMKEDMENHVTTGSEILEVLKPNRGSPSSAIWVP
jgi:hypothetical protein